MIYEKTAIAEPVRQGDIFTRVPCVDMSPRSLPVIDDAARPRELSWRDVLAEGGSAVTVALAMNAVAAVVVSQDCDNIRAERLTLARVEPFTGLLSGTPNAAKGWASKIVQNIRTNFRYFYLPEATGFGLEERMVADLGQLFQLPREGLEELRELRRGRLNQVAAEHFRETIAHFYRRYAFNEWYPLTRDEFAAYAAGKSGVEPFPWQL